MNKLSAPLKGSIKITQTTHGHVASAPNNLKFQRAVDLTSYSDDVLAQADGTVKKAINTGNYNSYIEILYSGITFPKQHVHTIPLVKQGQKIVRGQVIGKLAPSVYDKKKKIYIFLKHLHDAFYDATGKGKAPHPFDYLERKVKLYASHPEILATNWFKKGVFQWGVFKNLFMRIVLAKGRYELTVAKWIKQKPDTQFPNFKKIEKGKVGEITSGVVTNGGYDWQYIVYKDTAGWIPNTDLVKTTKPISNVIIKPPVETPTSPVPEVITPPVSENTSEPVSEDLGQVEIEIQPTPSPTPEPIEVKKENSILELVEKFVSTLADILKRIFRTKGD